MILGLVKWQYISIEMSFTCAEKASKHLALSLPSGNLVVSQGREQGPKVSTGSPQIHREVNQQLYRHMSLVLSVLLTGNLCCAIQRGLLLCRRGLGHRESTSY